MIVKIQHRRGDFTDFDPTQLLPGELAIIQADDPNTNDGTAIYLGISSGVIKRIPTSDEISDLVDALVETALDGKQDVLIFDVAPTAGSENVLSSGTIYTALSTNMNEVDAKFRARIPEFVSGQYSYGDIRAHGTKVYKYIGM